MVEKPEGELNNKFLTISVSDSFREMVDKLHWQYKMSKSQLLREAVVWYARNRELQNEKSKEG